jgi:hypothetical protein
LPKETQGVSRKISWKSTHASSLEQRREKHEPAILLSAEKGDLKPGKTAGLKSPDNTRSFLKPKSASYSHQSQLTLYLFEVSLITWYGLLGKTCLISLFRRLYRFDQFIRTNRI